MGTGDTINKKKYLKYSHSKCSKKINKLKMVYKSHHGDMVIQLIKKYVKYSHSKCSKNPCPYTIQTCSGQVSFCVGFAVSSR